jgi:hypothetical protein
MEEEASKHRITQSDLDFTDTGLKYSKPLYGSGARSPYYAYGRIRNRSAYTLKSVTLRVRLQDSDSGDIIGNQITTIHVDIPPHESRVYDHYVSLPDITGDRWNPLFNVTEIRGKEIDVTDLAGKRIPDIFDRLDEEVGNQARENTLIY